MPSTRNEIRPILETLQGRLYKACNYPSTGKIIVATIAECIKLGLLLELVEAGSEKDAPRVLTDLFTEANTVMVHFNNGMPDKPVVAADPMFRRAARVAYLCTLFFDDLPTGDFDQAMWISLLKEGGPR